MENVHHLRAFLAVADTLSFTKAAERVFLTQSAISHQMSNLERDLGCELVERRGRTISLTSAGRALVPHARRVFLAMDEATAAAKHAAKPGLGRLRIGASSTACQYIIPEALREFRESFPGYTLSITPGDSPSMLEYLLDGTVDLALMIKPEQQRKITFHHLFQDDLRLMVSPLHAWAKSGKADRRELAEQQMVLYSRTSTTSRMIERYFAKLQAPLRDWIELGDFGAIKELVKLGLGISVSAEWVTRPEIDEGSLMLLPLPGGRLRRTWCIGATVGRKLSAAEQTFIGLCQAVAVKFK